jgi:hypothetical protein
MNLDRASAGQGGGGRVGRRIRLIALVNDATGAPAYFVQTLRQTLCLVHFKVQQHRLGIGCVAIHQLIARSMSAFGGTALNETASRNVRRGLANVCA